MINALLRLYYGEKHPETLPDDEWAMKYEDLKFIKRMEGADTNWWP